MRLRDATAEDLPFLHAMLYEAAEWRGEPRPPLEDVLARPEIAQYLDGWPRPGDSGVIAEANDEPLGAAWYRFFTSDAPAYGFVDETIPELGVGVRADSRGHGVGRALLTELLEHARESGIPAVSLSVEADNPALRLYGRLGFEPIERDGESLTMLRRL